MAFSVEKNTTMRYYWVIVSDPPDTVCSYFCMDVCLYINVYLHLL
jgi:hypothetical protein